MQRHRWLAKVAKREVLEQGTHEEEIDSASAENDEKGGGVDIVRR